MTLRRALKRLRLKSGDILVVQRDSGLYPETLIDAGRGLNLNCPIVFVDGKHGVQKLSFDELETLYLMAKGAR